MRNCFYRLFKSLKTTANHPAVVLLTYCLAYPSMAVFAETPIVAVASNLTTPMTEIAEEFRLETGETIRLSFGSSGNLSRQIVQGAPYDIFISASVEYMNFITAENVVIKRQFKFVEGEIGFYIPQDSSIASLQSIEEVINALKFGHQGRVAIANPEHAPYGIAAIEALQNGGAWSLSAGNMIYSESVAQIVPFIHSGNIDLAVIPKSFILQNALKDSGIYFPINPSWYQPVTQYVAVLKDSNPVTFSFIEFLTSNHALTILKKHGYEYTGDQ